jgi:hypothetical protein
MDAHTCKDEYCGWVEGVDTSRRHMAEVWWCGDEWCDCTEARITSYLLAFPGRRDIRNEWEGAFMTDGEGHDVASTELNRMAQHLRRHHHDFYRLVQWPWDRK